MKTYSFAIIASLLLIFSTFSSAKSQNINFTVLNLQEGLKTASTTPLPSNPIKKADSVGQSSGVNIFYNISQSSLKDSLGVYQYTHLTLKAVWSGYRDGGRVITSPLRWKRNDWLKVIAISGGAIALHQLDVPINEVVNRNNTPFIKGFSNTFQPFGNVFYVVPALLGVYGIGSFSHDEQLSGFAIAAGKAVIISNALVTYAKVVTHRHRPNDDTPTLKNKWDGPRADLKNVSFFSSHTATAFALATTISSNYSEHKWVSPVAYTMASLVGISRITANEHWATDVFVGAVVGYSVGKLIDKLNRSKKIKLVIGL